MRHLTAGLLSIFIGCCLQVHAQPALVPPLGTITGIDATETVEELTVVCYPNPASDLLQVVVNLPNNKRGSSIDKAVLTDAIGRIIEEVALTGENVLRGSIRVSHLSQGRYTLCIPDSDELLLSTTPIMIVR